MPGIRLSLTRQACACLVNERGAFGLSLHVVSSFACNEVNNLYIRVVDCQHAPAEMNTSQLVGEKRAAAIHSNTCTENPAIL